MNPPPLPSAPGSGKSLARQAASAALLVPLLVIVIGVVNGIASAGSASHKTASMVVLSVDTLLVVAGLAFSIFALASNVRQNSPGVVWRAVTGLVLNGLFLACFVCAFFWGYLRVQQSRVQASQEMQSAERDFNESVKRSYNSKTGITNFDMSKLDQFEARMTNATQKLSGDDAKIAEAMGAFFGRLNVAMRNYKTALESLQAGHVLGPAMEKSELVDRRQIVRQFIDANDQLTGVVTNAEMNLRADLVRLNVSSGKIEETLAGYRKGSASKMQLTTEVRRCDDRMGQAMLDAIDLLDSEWGRWNFDSTANYIRFQSATARANYDSDVAAIRSAGDTQVRLQKLLIQQ